MEENNNYLKFLITEDIYPERDRQNKNDLEKGGQTPESAAANAAVENEKAVLKEPESEKYAENPSKKLLVLYTYEPEAKLDKELKQLMLKIIEAVKIDIFSADYVNASHQALPEQLNDYENILCFSYDLDLKMKSIAKENSYAIQKSGLTKILFSATLETLNKDIEEKKKLWASLQTMFPG